MSRIANQPVEITEGVKVTLGKEIVVEGPKGKLSMVPNEAVSIEQVDNELLIKAKTLAHFKGRPRGYATAQSGTARALLNNMVLGVSKGFEKRLKLVGVGYRAQAQGKKLNLTLGLSHPVEHEIPEGITITTPSQTEVVVEGIDKQVVGQVAADIRSYRLPEPYKGKGIRYADERIVLKETKKK